MTRAQRRRHRAAALAVWLITTSTAAFAQQMPRSVTVTDASGAPIPLAEIKIQAGDKTTDALSDEQGRIKIDPGVWDGAGLLHLTVSAVGYTQTSVDLDERTSADTVVRLSPAAADTGDIVVLARRISRPFSPQTLTFLDIVTDPKAQADPILAVNNLPASTNVTGSSRITFRGSRAAINRAFLNNTPVYEFSTGSELDNSTENRSIFGLVLADDVETYPGNPPAYLAAGTGGAVRILTPDNKLSATTISVTDLGISGGHSFASPNGDDFVALYASLTDLSLHREINPGLKSLYKTIRSGSAGGFGHLTTKDGGTVNVFVQAEAADDEFPFISYGQQSLFRLQPLKVRSVVSASVPISGVVVDANAAFTHSEIEEVFSGLKVANTNDYGFFSLSVARRSLQDRISLRGGFDAEYIRQVSDTALRPFGIAASSGVPSRAFLSDLQQVTGYVFASYRFTDAAIFSLGARRTFVSNVGSGVSLQASVALSSADRRHKVIISGGKYTGTAVPTRAYYGPITRSVSRQIEVNYSWSFPSGILGVSGYMSGERTDGGAFSPDFLNISSVIDNLTGFARRTNSGGIEAYATWTPTRRLEARLSFASVQQTLRLGTNRLRGANDYPAIVRASIKYSTPSLDTYSLSFTSRSGESFTPAVGTSNLFGSSAPVFGGINAARLPEYLSLDASASRHLRIPGLTEGPLVFFAINNMTDHRNPSSQTLTLPGEPIAYRNLAGRTVVIGATITF